MKRPATYQTGARKYRTLAAGNAALHSPLAGPCEGAAEALQHLAAEETATEAAAACSRPK